MVKKVYTRGQILLERQKDEVFDAALEACKKNKWKVKRADKTKYQIEARIPFSWIKNEFVSNVQIFLTDGKYGDILTEGKYGHTLLDIYNDYFARVTLPTPTEANHEKIL